MAKLNATIYKGVLLDWGLTVLSCGCKSSDGRNGIRMKFAFCLFFLSEDIYIILDLYRDSSSIERLKFLYFFLLLSLQNAGNVDCRFQLLIIYIFHLYRGKKVHWIFVLVHLVLLKYTVGFCTNWTVDVNVLFFCFHRQILPGSVLKSPFLRGSFIIKHLFK